MAHDFYADTFDTIEDKHYVYSAKTPDNRREVVSLLDSSGEETDDPEAAVGGVVKIAEECYTTFMWNR